MQGGPKNGYLVLFLGWIR